MNTRLLGNLAALGLSSMLLANTALAAQDHKVIHGAACQALIGSQETRLNHNVDWLSNKSGNTWVTCPLPRDKVYNNTPPEAQVRVYRPPNAAALDCQFLGRTLNGTNYIASGAAVAGWRYVTMTLPGNAAGASYAVRCRLPEDARVQKTLLKEF